MRKLDKQLHLIKLQLFARQKAKGVYPKDVRYCDLSVVERKRLETEARAKHLLDSLV
jgi:hypothetical protein